MIEQAAIERAIKDLFENIEFQEKPEGLYDPLRYMIAIGGKRIRPRLCLTTYGIYADELKEGILEPAAAMEVFHTFTLIHDDIMDRSPLRRGHETVWKKWDSDTAVLSGDAMYTDSFRRILKAPREVLPQALKLFIDTASGIMDGQQMDMDFEKRDNVSMEEYMTMTGLKTGVLLACSAGMGALIGGADEWSLGCLYEYGYHLGLAFQVADDYLDAYGDEKVFGKPIGGDILNEKKSWLTIRALEKGAKDIIPALKAHDIPAVMAIYGREGVAEDALKAIGDLSARAVTKGAAAHMDEGGVQVLKDFAHSLVGRVK